MLRRLTLLLPLLLCHGCVQNTLINFQGATAPCAGAGPAAVVAVDYCVNRFKEQGFLESGDIGVSGLTVGLAGDQDGVVTAVDAGSPAAGAGLNVGDEIVAVNGRPVRLTPGAVATQRLFGKTGAAVKLSIRQRATARDVDLVRVSQPVQVNDPTPSPLVMSFPFIDASGHIIPCNGAGIGVLLVLSKCNDLYAKFGYVHVTDVGSVGIQIDDRRTNGAFIGQLAPDLPAVKAGLKVGDEIVAVDGAPLTSSKGRIATEALFGRKGSVVAVTARHNGVEKTVSLTLVAKR
jgi:C-terminal processing protease CtpA/Prc